MTGSTGVRDADERDTIRVLIADDHPSARFGVRVALSDAPRFQVCAEAATAEEAVLAAEQERPDLCVIDVRMPGDGIRAAASIRQKVPGARIVMLTVSEDEHDLLASIRAGADGYLLKDGDAERTVIALEAALEGEAAIPRRLVAHLVGEFQGRARRRSAVFPGADALTDREGEVLELMSDGLSTEDIAHKMYVTPVTVRSHVSAILKKLHVKDRLAAVRLFQSGT